MSTETVDTALAIRTWTEAPASLNIKVNLAGYDVMLTLSGDSGTELLHKLRSAIATFGDMGAMPTGVAPSTVRTNGNGNGHSVTVEETPVCAIHGTPMTQRQNSKTGASFWSCGAKLPDGSWCPYRPTKK